MIIQNILKISTLIFILSPLGFSLIIAQSPISTTLSKAQVQRLDESLSPWDKENSPGVAVIVMHHNQVVYQRCHGLADVTNNIPISTKTKFPMAEITTHFTAMAALYLEQKGQLRLDRSVQYYMKDLPEFYRKITLNDLLQHSTGIEDFNRLNFMVNKLLYLNLALKLPIPLVTC